MKTKRRTFWSFFTRIGAGFLAFWLAVMAVFTVLLSQQRAKLMLAEMESKSDKLMGEDTDCLLDPSSYDTTDETELRRRLSKPVFMADSAVPAQSADHRDRYHRPEIRQSSAKQPLVA